MDFNSIINSAQFMSVNTAHIPLSSLGSNTVIPGESGLFGDILKTMQNSQERNEGSIPRSAFSWDTPIDKTDKLYEVCLELETILIKNLIKSMRSTVQKNSLIDTGFAGEIYEDMLYDEYSKTLARNASFGFAEMAYRDLDRLRN